MLLIACTVNAPRVALAKDDLTTLPVGSMLIVLHWFVLVVVKIEKVTLEFKRVGIGSFVSLASANGGTMAKSAFILAPHHSTKHKQQLSHGR
jgi:hypothetical protein